MKRVTYLIITTVLFCSSVSKSQIAYYDALEIRNLTKDKKMLKPADSILNKYYKLEPYRISLKDSINIEIKKNPFLKDYKVEIGNMFSRTSAKQLVSSLSGLDVTTIAYGLSEFLVERAKEELTIAFFQRFKNFLNKNPESKVLFPESSAFIENMLAHEYTTWLPLIQEKFLDDLENVFFKFDDVLELPKYKQINEELPEMLLCLNIMETIHKNTINNTKSTHPAELLDTIAKLSNWKKVKSRDSKNIRALFQTTNLISQSLRFYNDAKPRTLIKNTNDSIVQHKTCLVEYFKNKTDTIQTWDTNAIAWVTPKHLQLLLNDKIAFQIYLGLLYQQAIRDSIYYYPYKITRYVKDSLTIPNGTIYSGSIIKSDSIRETRKYYKFTVDSNISDTAIVFNGIYILKDTLQYFNKKPLKISDSILFLKGDKPSKLLDTVSRENVVMPLGSDIKIKGAINMDTTIIYLGSYTILCDTTKNKCKKKRLKYINDSIRLIKGTIYFVSLFDSTEYKNGLLQLDTNITIDTVTTYYAGSVITYKTNSIGLSNILSGYKDDIYSIRNLFEDFNTLTTEFDLANDSIRYKKKNNIDISKEDYKRYVSASFSTVNYGFDVIDYLDVLDSDKLENYKDLSNSLESTAINIYNNQYSIAMLNASNALGTISDIIKTNKDNIGSSSNSYDSVKTEYDLMLESYDKVNGKAPKEVKKIKKSDIANQKSNTEETATKTAKKLLRYSQNIMYYGSFMAGVIEAKNSADVKAIISNTALPAGSSSLKKYNRHNVAVNAYLGAGYHFHVKHSIKMYAPIGISYTPFAWNKGGSLSAYVGLIDLGAVVNDLLRVSNVETENNDTLNTSNKISLGNIFSPGFNIVYGSSWNLPFALSFGYQYTPGLIKVIQSDYVIGKPYYTWNLSLTIDLPMYTLYSGHPYRNNRKR